MIIFGLRSAAGLPDAAVGLSRLDSDASGAFFPDSRWLAAGGFALGARALVCVGLTGVVRLPVCAPLVFDAEPTLPPPTVFGAALALEESDAFPPTALGMLAFDAGRRADDPVADLLVPDLPGAGVAGANFRVVLFESDDAFDSGFAGAAVRAGVLERASLPVIDFEASGLRATVFFVAGLADLAELDFAGAALRATGLVAAFFFGAAAALREVEDVFAAVRLRWVAIGNTRTGTIDHRAPKITQRA